MFSTFHLKHMSVHCLTNDLFFFSNDYTVNFSDNNLVIDILIIL